MVFGFFLRGAEDSVSEGSGEAPIEEVKERARLRPVPRTPPLRFFSFSYRFMSEIDSWSLEAADSLARREPVDRMLLGVSEWVREEGVLVARAEPGSVLGRPTLAFAGVLKVESTSPFDWFLSVMFGASVRVGEESFIVMSWSSGGTSSSSSSSLSSSVL